MQVTLDIINCERSNGVEVQEEGIVSSRQRQTEDVRRREPQPRLREVVVAIEPIEEDACLQPVCQSEEVLDPINKNAAHGTHRCVCND